MADPDPTQPGIVETALDALERLGYGDEKSIGEPFEISCGAMLRAVSAPPHLIADIELSYPEPEPPMVDITDSTTDEVIRQEPNPDDPDYRTERLKWMETIERMRQRALLATAIEVVSVPEGVPGPDDDEWIDLIHQTGLTEIADAVPPTGTRGRRLAWLLYFALADVADLNMATVRAIRMVGVPERDVATLARLFQDLQERGEDLRRPTPATSQD